MFFRFYILIILGSLSVLPTSLWFGGILILIWFISMPISGVSYYKRWKAHHSILNIKSLSYCIKSIKRQKQNFKILNIILRKKILIQFFKKLSILLDDINVKASHKYIDDYPIQRVCHLNAKVHNPIYSHLPSNLYYSRRDLFSK